MLDLPTLALSSSLLLQAATPVQCRVPEAPVININPITAAIEYDVSKSTFELTKMKSGTVSPYGLSADQTTGGLRHDQPSVSVDIKFGQSYDETSGSFCAWYKEITLNIEMRPKIYIAKEYNVGGCGAAILHHEKKHVKVDRIITNKYAKQIGMDIQRAVNQAGALGPFTEHEAASIKKHMYSHIQSAMASSSLLMRNEMNKYQQQVDSLEEYERVSKVCDEFVDKEAIFSQQQKLRDQ